MTYTTSSDAPGTRCLGAWLLILTLAVTAACSAPAGSEPEAAPLLGSPGVVAESSPEAGDQPGELSQPVGGQTADSEELIGLGELGLLPSLLQTFGAGIDCDFDDAFSTCQ